MVSPSLDGDAARVAFAQARCCRSSSSCACSPRATTSGTSSAPSPTPYPELFTELLAAPLLQRDDAYTRALLAPFIADDQGLSLMRAAAHTLRAFASYELIVAGDLGDCGPRLDKVIDAIRRQNNVRIIWGNHDAEWMGATLAGGPRRERGADLAALRASRPARGRLRIPVEPLEQLAREAYGDDPAERFRAKGEDLRDPLLLARMQKAIAIIQFKLDAQTRDATRSSSSSTATCCTGSTPRPAP